uniref:Peptidase_S9 domain-containing protein n=1 Tax=Caenorhabditis japonica TaxID=281687 RepID=A0A8R1E481_CAEJA
MSIMKRLNVLYCHGLGSSINCRHATQLQAYFDDQKDVYFERFKYENPGSLDHVWNINEWRRDIEKRIGLDNQTWVLMATSGASHAALNIAKSQPDKIQGLFLMCPGTSLGVDFVETISPGTFQKLLAAGHIEYPPSRHGHPALLNVDCLEEFVKTDICAQPGALEIYCPILVAHGEMDNIVPIENSAAMLQRIQSKYKDFIRLEDANHYFDLDQTILKKLDSLMNFIWENDTIQIPKRSKL